LFASFLMFQGVRARMHALDYRDDLVFWDATRRAVPRSAKAHLNYSVMWGARGRLDVRLEENRLAAQLAPKWPMAHIYLGDTLCRLHRSEEAWPHYKQGFELAPGDPNLIALSLQCLWDESSLEPHADELNEMADSHPGSWLAYLAVDTLRNGKTTLPPV
jgi:protein O-mannosyl-transferase